MLFPLFFRGVAFVFFTAIYEHIKLRIIYQFFLIGLSYLPDLVIIIPIPLFLILVAAVGDVVGLLLVEQDLRLKDVFGFAGFFWCGRSILGRIF